MTMQKLAYTLEEAAMQCGCSASTLASQMADGKLMARYANGELLIRHEDLAKWLQGLPTGASDGPASPNARIGKKEVISKSERPRPVFRTPEEVAPELGMSKTELRRYCRESGINTRLSSNRIMLSQDDVERLMEWVRTRGESVGAWDEEDSEPDAFA
ncbi:MULTISPECIES: helix-turn-helix domain-containing protein [Arthrobacter]|uniref:DNA-binding protein n=1 Tax=Arthrobacter terricola TaxID=2547396 RepID=A0A4R5KA48_9MICC|nr:MULTISPECIES: helix-turn-helix domain-containing protein [Arthrobacter]MBT8162775.1 helix-turn-helix domain-containing protein [Arthrobacter sp. GN70]TDF92063.1 DNA-binding protein [Arthrobacter terricola]